MSALDQKSPLRIAVLLSGSGTTLQNLIDHEKTSRLAGTIVGVISSRSDVRGVERAHAAGLPVTVVTPKPGVTFSDRVFEAVRVFHPDLVCLAGWLHLIRIPGDFEGRVLNIHPSLLPAYGGKGMYGHHVHEAVIRAGETRSGCTVHFADNSYDTGPILLQRSVPVESKDTPESLAARVFQAECEAYPEAIRLMAKRFADKPVH